MNDPIRWGIIGTGQIARHFAQALSDVPSARLWAVASREHDSAQAFGSDFEVPQCYGDYAALASDPQVDVVYIATPHVLHAQNCLMCLHAGKAVLCEKPFTMNASEAREVITLARQKKLFLMEAMWSRFLPSIQEARRIAESGEIGRLRHLHAAFSFAVEVDARHRLRNPELGGGALMDIGVYLLSLAAYFLGPVESVQALARLGDTGVDEETAFTLRHRGGALSICICSTRAHAPIELTLAGELGFLRLHEPFFKAEAVTVMHRDGAARTLSLPFNGNGYTHEAMEVGRCLREGLTESSLMPLDDSVALLECMDAMRRQFGLRYASDGAGEVG